MNFALSIVVKTTLLLLSASLLSTCLRRAAASTRHAIWTVALTGTLLLPAASFVLPAIELPVLSETTVETSSHSEPLVSHLENSDFQIGLGIQDPPTNTAIAPTPLKPSRRWPLEWWIALGWALGAVFVGVRFLIGMGMIRGIARHSGASAHYRLRKCARCSRRIVR
jgi:heme/copper-type cytochrome/quinol oxidase subunit 3